MSDKKLKQRSDIPKQYKWNIEAMYPDESQWEKDIDDCLSRAEKFGDYRGRLTRSAPPFWKPSKSVTISGRRLNMLMSMRHEKR